jgi:hypothetical protein
MAKNASKQALFLTKKYDRIKSRNKKYWAIPLKSIKKRK